MKFDKITERLSPDTPCGPDLLADEDNQFVDYFYEAEGRLPQKYYDLIHGTLFDSKSVDHAGEAKQIEALLSRSLDLRLMGLQAKFQILAGRLTGFCEAVIAMADLIETYPEEAHPQTHGNVDARRGAIEAINTLATVIVPLQYASLIDDRRTGSINQRMYILATGQVEPREGEIPGDASAIMTVLGSEENQAAVADIYSRLAGAKDAVARIISACKSHNPSFTPDLENLDGRLQELCSLLEQARPDLIVDEEPETEEIQATSEVPGDQTQETVSSGVGAISIPTHSAARRALEVAEAYFAHKEPSAASLLLVTQARLLIGKQLVEALDTLLPDNANQAKIDFGAETGFVISMDRLRNLSSEMRPPSGPNLNEAQGEFPDLANTRIEAQALIKAVEDFYRRAEPVSPIPILLAKARSYLEKDFHAIVKELLPTQSSGSQED